MSKDVREVESYSEEEARRKASTGSTKFLPKRIAAYFENDAPELTDAAYDALKRR